MEQNLTSSPAIGNTIVGSSIICRYKITYGNGFVQFKNLISHSDFENIIKKAQDLIYDLQQEKKDENDEMIDNIKTELKTMFGDDWFTDRSPLFLAKETGILSLPQAQGGDHFCKLEAV